ncbi:hypothetical protein F2P79_011820 [Pimephales promelas]|nr:hypothetical protein F2P79_011820 [Pimephales promelas]
MYFSSGTGQTDLGSIQADVASGRTKSLRGLNERERGLSQDSINSTVKSSTGGNHILQKIAFRVPQRKVIQETVSACKTQMRVTGIDDLFSRRSRLSRRQCQCDLSWVTGLELGLRGLGYHRATVKEQQ